MMLFDQVVIGPISESDHHDPKAPVAQGTAPPVMYQCNNDTCHRMIGVQHKYWPLCSSCWYNRAEVPI